MALEPFEAIKNVKIVRVLPNNVVMLNRGLEDGIQRNDHAKLSNDTEGYSSRAICLRVTSELSYWKIYRVPNAEAFSLDYLYTITGMADKEIPSPELNLRDAKRSIEGLEDEKSSEIKRDLPERLTEKDLIQATGSKKRR